MAGSKLWSAKPDEGNAGVGGQGFGHIILSERAM